MKKQTKEQAIKEAVKKCPYKKLCKEYLLKEKGCGKRVRVGYNKKLDCPITNICGITEIYGCVYLCGECKKGLKE